MVNTLSAFPDIAFWAEFAADAIYGVLGETGDSLGNHMFCVGQFAIISFDVCGVGSGMVAFAFSATLREQNIQIF